MSAPPPPMTEEEILTETVLFYAEDPSRVARTDVGCMYLTADGRKCAVGRCMQDDLSSALFNVIGGVTDLQDTACEILGNSSTLDDVLKPQYRGQSLKFWQNLQALHDNSGNWRPTPRSRDFLRCNIASKFTEDLADAVMSKLPPV